MSCAPRVSVLLAARNGAYTLDAALESLVEQTYMDWEAVLVDDGSTDATLVRMREWEERDARFRVVTNRSNVGLAASLNIAFAEARGELIARLDCDDACLPERFAKQVAFLDAYPEVDVLGGGAELVSNTGEGLGSILMPVSHADLVAEMYRKNPFIHPTVMFRRCFFEEIGRYDPRLSIRAQDIDLWLRGYRRFRYHNLPEVLIRHRVVLRPSARSILMGGFVVARSGLRDRRPLRGGWFAVRSVVSGTLTAAGLLRHNLRRGAARAR